MATLYMVYVLCTPFVQLMLLYSVSPIEAGILKITGADSEGQHGRYISDHIMFKIVNPP